jgi:hypothetical protein
MGSGRETNRVKEYLITITQSENKVAYNFLLRGKMCVTANLRHRHHDLSYSLCWQHVGS